MVAVGAGGIFHRRVDNGSRRQLPGKILMTVQTELADGSAQQPLADGLVGVVALAAGADRRRTMLVHLPERSIVMAGEAKIGLILPAGQQIRVSAAVHLVTSQAIPFGNRGVHHSPLAQGIVALKTERRTLLRQFKTLHPFTGMLDRHGDVAGPTFAIGYRLVCMGMVCKTGMAASRYTAFGLCCATGPQQQAARQQKNSLDAHAITLQSNLKL